jgi:DNA mismatch repair protein MutS
MQQTPLMRQYFKIKSEHPDTILFFRVGDFFETFEDDAKIASKVLGITLTKRSNGAAGDVPLAGFPHHAIDSYLPKLVRAGYRVAICEQMEDPKFAKGIVKREVVEVVTPGVTLSDKLLDHKKNNYLAAIFIQGDFVGISFSDVSTGDFFVYESRVSELLEQLILINPSEILYQKKDKEILERVISKAGSSIRLTKIEDWLFNLDFAKELLTNHFKTVTLKGFGIETLTLGLISAGVVLHYLNDTQKVNLSHINKISIYNPTEYMILDYSTKRNLEIITSMQGGGREGSLLEVLDQTQTPMGGRLLKSWVSAPLRNVKSIKQRLNAVDDLFVKKSKRKELLEILKEIGDLERLISKISTGRANARDVISLKSSLEKIPSIKSFQSEFSDPTLYKIFESMFDLSDVVEKISAAILDNPAASLNEGGIIKNGYSPELDELRQIAFNAKDYLANLQQRERERTQIPSLKVNYNKVFGYYIEISNAHKNKIPEDYIRKQTLVNSERYITPELKEFEEKILTAEERINSLEYQLFNEIRYYISQKTSEIQQNAKLIAMLDVFNSFAEIAEKYNYVKPEINEGSLIDIKKGRHPVVERILPPGEKFTPNDCYLDNESQQIILLTGPNMAGKSVYLRQVGLIVLLAQIGSFVPAESATIGIVDRIFTRVGASDNITAGESTFLVEMQEAANILNNATSKSLVLLDEIGRGTSTFDGISIAWAITEYLHENPNIAAKTLFATHYHELNEMADIFPRIKNYKVEVREYDDKVIFLHRVNPGKADHSYGIQVAMMAGLPNFVTNRAKEILNNLESKELTPYEIKKERLKKIKSETDSQINLFEFKDDKFREEIKNIEINNLTPLEALNKLSEIKTKMEKDEL